MVGLGLGAGGWGCSGVAVWAGSLKQIEKPAWLVQMCLKPSLFILLIGDWLVQWPHMLGIPHKELRIFCNNVTIKFTLLLMIIAVLCRGEITGKGKGVQCPLLGELGSSTRTQAADYEWCKTWTHWSWERGWSSTGTFPFEVAPNLKVCISFGKIFC